MTPGLLDTTMGRAPPSILADSSRLPQHVEALLAELVRRENIDEERLVSLYQCVQGGGVPDYDRDALVFAYLYFAANYAKARAALRTVEPLLGGTIVDLGAGSGASTIAILESLRAVGMSARVVAVDTSAPQVALLQKVLRAYGATLVDVRHMDWREAIATVRADVVVSAFLANELGDEDAQEFFDYSVGSKDSIVWLTLEHCPRGTILRTTGHESLIRYPSQGLDVWNLQARAALTIAPKASHTGVARQRLLEYFCAWETHDVGGLDRIFHRHAKYRINGTRVLDGIAAIAGYWSRNAVQQRDVRCEIHNMVDLGAQATCTWGAEFRRVDRGSFMKLQGRMRITVKDGLIIDLAEHYMKDEVRDGRRDSTLCRATEGSSPSASS